MSHDHWPHEEDGQAPAEEQAPYEPFWVRWRKPVTDEQFVERIRKNRISLNRWKLWLIALYVAPSIVFLFLTNWLASFAVDQILQAKNLNPQLGRGLILTMCGMGFGFGVQLSHCVIAVHELIRGNRANDLLLKYHDLAQQHEHTDHTT